MLFYLLIILLINYLGDYLYDDCVDILWYRYFIFLIVFLGGVAYFSY